MASVNPQILTWARETAGLSLDEAARQIKLNSAHGRSAIRRNRRLPDVCAHFNIPCINTFQMNRALEWRTNWQT